MGGGWFTVSGNGAEYICLAEDPDYIYQSTVSQFSLIYSTEYRTQDKVFDNPTEEYDAPCAVCLAPRSAKMMIPGKASCPNSWTVEYSGYLMSASHTHGSNKNYVCIDGHAKTILGSQDNTEGALLYFVVANCDRSFLPCLPFIKNVPITCVVCTI